MLTYYPKTEGYTMQRKFNSAYDGRTGAPKRIVEAQPVVGHKRQTTGDLHPYLHGQLQDDIVPEKSFAKKTPIHSAHANNQTLDSSSAKDVLKDAGNFGRPDDGDKD
jgi:hypothetical protein